MKTMYITVTGMNFYYGTEFVKEGMVVTLTKEPDNEHDAEAIKVEMEGLGTVGHVANSVKTVMGESMSAGRLYDKIGDTCEATVKYVFPGCVMCVVNAKEMVQEEEESEWKENEWKENEWEDGDF